MSLWNSSIDNESNIIHFSYNSFLLFFEISMWIWPIILAAVYFLAILGYAAIYYFFENLWPTALSFADSLYFSAVTITTLGYGDISPKTVESKYLAASEALVGITLIGLFLTSLAYYLSNASDSKRKKAYRKHFVRQYAFFKLQMIAHCVDAVIAETDQKYSSSRDELVKTLLDPIEFDNFFTDNNMEEWYNLQNGMQYNEGIVSDMYLELDLLVEQINQLLATFGSSNEQALSGISGFYKDAIRLRNGRHTSHDPAKYFSQFVFGVLADKSIHTHKRVNQNFMDNVNAL